MAKKKSVDLSPLQAAAEKLLTKSWEEVLLVEDMDAVADPDLSPKIQSLISDGGSTYPFMLLTQILGKASSPELNAMCIQESSELPGAWDARSLASRVVVEWNRSADRPFPGANDDPYVNNPARSKNFGSEMKAKAGKQEDYKNLAEIVQRAQEGGEQEAKSLLKLILIETRRSLEKNKRDYFGPAKMSVEGIMLILKRFLAVKSNGVRLQIVCYALYQSFSEAYPSLGEVSSAATNAPDINSNRTGDIECGHGMSVTLAIEVKDRKIRANDVTSTVLKARKNKVNNVLFVTLAEGLFEDEKEIYAKAQAEFSRGIDVNFAHFEELAFYLLLQLSPEQRAASLRKIHDALHEKGANYSHVKHWMELLKTV